MGSEKDKFDCIVIGGGIIGASIAFHLVLTGKEVLIIDADYLGKATKAGAGIISAATTMSDNEDLYRLAIASEQYYPHFVTELAKCSNMSSGYKQSVEVLLAEEDEVDVYKTAIGRIFDRQQSSGFPTQGTIYELVPDEFSSRFPRIKKPSKALVYETAGQIDGKQMTDVILDAGKKLGLQVLADEVTRLLIKNEVCIGVSTNGIDIYATNVVIAGGAWSLSFAEQLAFYPKLQPQRGQIIHFKTEVDFSLSLPIILTMRGYYSLSWDNGKTIFGATREMNSGFHPHNTTKGVHEVLAQAMRVLPDIVDQEIDEIRVGLRPYSLDGVPILGKVPGKKGVWIATGHGPLGLTTAPITGKLMAHMITNQEPEIDMTPFSPSRFSVL